MPPEVDSSIGGARTPSGTTPDAGGIRTSPFASLADKAAAIVNRTALGGYGEMFFTKREGEDSFFDPRRFVVFLYSPIAERISVATEVEFEHGGSPAKHDGQLTQGEAQLEFAVLDVKVADALTLRAGIVLVPFGRFNINHDAPTQDLSDRPLSVTFIVPSTWFEAGAGFVGRVALGGSVDLNYEAYAINGLDSKIQDGLGYRAARGSKLQDNNDDKGLVGRVGLYHLGRILGRQVSFDLGFSAYSGAYNRAGKRATLLGGDLALRIGRFELVGEAARGFNEPGFDDDYASSSRGAVPEDLWGGFAEARYHVMPEALRRALPSWLHDSVFTLVARYDQIDTDMSRTTSPGDRARVTFGLNFRPIEAIAWKHELQLDQSGGRSGPKHVFDNPRLAYVTSVAFLF